MDLPDTIKFANLLFASDAVSLSSKVIIAAPLDSPS